MKITHTGTNVSASTVIDGPMFASIKARAIGGAAVISINGHEIPLDNNDGSWENFDAEGNRFVIVSGSVSYVVFG